MNALFFCAPRALPISYLIDGQDDNEHADAAASARVSAIELADRLWSSGRRGLALNNPRVGLVTRLWSVIMSTRNAFAILLLALCGWGLGVRASAAGSRESRSPDTAEVTSGALTYYAECVNEAIDRFAVAHLDRHLIYRCYGDSAVAYFNYLGRQRTPDQLEEQPTGLFIFRTIRGKGRCWNMVADAYGRQLSEYGCYIFEQI
jgi:hypothetical protein